MTTISPSAKPRRLLSISHSYCVALNRRLAHELACAGAGEWEVTAVAPEYFRGDLRSIHVEPYADEQCTLVKVPVRFSSRVHVMLYGRKLRALLREPWDVVHCWEEPFVAAAAQVARAKHVNSKLVFATFQNLPKLYPPPFNFIESYAMRRATGWIAFGQTIEQNLAPNRLYANLPHRVIPLGVDTAAFYPCPARRSKAIHKLGWQESGPLVIGYLGRFVAEKGLALLMNALDQVAVPWRALFVGAGPMEAALRNWAAGREQIKIVTGVAHGDVPEYLNAMDLLCAPSQTMANWKEQLGRMLIEAFASGVPVLASDSGEIPHVVADAGLILPEQDVNQWSAAIERVLRDDNFRAALAARGLERARAVYSWSTVARQHLDFFSQLLAARS